MVLTLIDTFLPESSLQAPDQQRRGRLLVVGSFGFFLVCLVFGIQMSLSGHYPASSLAFIFSGCGFALINLYLLKKTRSVALPGLLFCLEASAIIAFQAYNDLGLNDPSLLWYIVIPWLAAFLLRPAAAFAFVGLAIAVIGGFYILELQGYPFPEYTSPEKQWLFLLLQLSAVTLYIGFLGWFYEGQTLKKLRAANQELRAAQEDLQASKQRIENILESISDGFFALDREGCVSYLNHHAERFFGQKREVLLGEGIERHLVQHLDVAARERLLEALRKNVPMMSSLYHGSLQRWFELRVYPFEAGHSVYLTDTTERKAYEEKLIEAKAKAEELAHLKSAFLANMSHEVRTPLTGILGFSNILADEVEGEHREFAQLIEGSAQRLLDTLDSILELTRLEGERLDPERRRVDVVVEVEEVIHLFERRAQARGLYLRLRGGDTPEDTFAVVDHRYLHRILNNLLSNAIKFTEEGGVTITVGGGEDQLCLQVADTGIGISPDFLPHLFEEFRQESMGYNRSHEGSGLGLHITKRLVETMGGTIEVNTEKDRGTTFTVCLPRRANAPAGAAGNR